MNLWVPLTPVVTFLWANCTEPKQRIGRSYEAWQRVLSKCGVDTEHLQRSKRSQDVRAKAVEPQPCEESSLDFDSAMDFRASPPGLTVLLVFWSLSHHFHQECKEERERALALLRGWCQHVMGSGCWALGGPDTAVPVASGEVLLDVLLDDQAKAGVPARSRT